MVRFLKKQIMHLDPGRSGMNTLRQNLLRRNALASIKGEVNILRRSLSVTGELLSCVQFFIKQCSLNVRTSIIVLSILE